jgi:hypothetical protein
MKTVLEREGKAEELQKDRKIELDDKVTKYSLQPISLGFFGGVLNFNKINVFYRKTFGFIRSQLEKNDFKESPPAYTSCAIGKKSADGQGNWQRKQRNSKILLF